MTDAITSRQHQILNLLLKNKEGLCIDQIAARLSISRNAVQQHFSKLERDGYVTLGPLHKTAGRPVRAYVLTEAGINSFPKQYAWFSELMLAHLKEELGPEALPRYLQKLAHSLSQGLLPKFEGLELEERLAELIHLMNDLGFQAEIAQSSTDGYQTIEAFNCIYHDLAQKHEEVCEFDRTLITTLLGKEIEHLECMAKGCALCSFRIKNQDARAIKIDALP
jgi:DeoR family transcriptional regulator, suf operon transcriptional repressor